MSKRHNVVIWVKFEFVPSFTKNQVTNDIPVIASFIRHNFQWDETSPHTWVSFSSRQGHTQKKSINVTPGSFARVLIFFSLMFSKLTCTNESMLLCCISVWIASFTVTILCLQGHSLCQSLQNVILFANVHLLHWSLFHNVVDFNVWIRFYLPPQEITQQDGYISATNVYYHVTNEITNTSTS